MESKELLDKSISEIEIEMSEYKAEMDELRIRLRKLKRIRKALGC